MKKIIKIGLIIALSFSIVACSDKKGSSDFEAWSATLPAQLLGNSDYILYSLFDDPKNVGIDMDVDGLTIVTKEDYEEDIKEYKALLKQLRTHDYDVLNEYWCSACRYFGEPIYCLLRCRSGGLCFPYHADFIGLYQFNYCCNFLANSKRRSRLSCSLKRSR